ncbi:ABZJ_00895 family protein [Litoreibacter sp.]|nr:ABZJ_00895 family protein [Litoreibacter sp.]
MHTTYLLKRYIVVAMLSMILISAISYGLETFTGVKLGSTIGIVAAIVPAMDAGQTYAKRWEKRPPNAYAWKLSAAFTVLNLLVGIVLMISLFAYFGTVKDLSDLIGQLATPLSGVIMVVILIVYWLASRYFFGFSAKNYLKAVARLAAKKS